MGVCGGETSPVCPRTSTADEWQSQLSHTRALSVGLLTPLLLGPAPLCCLGKEQGLLSSVLPLVRDGATSPECCIQ